MLETRTDGETIWVGNKFSFTLQRTLRIPDDGNRYPLPPGLGNFPIFHVSDYKDKLPEDWAKHGGVFIPMYQREALWVSFDGNDDRPHALKVAVGKINAVSGKPWDQSLKKEEKDYMVCPPQPWLDGINAGEGFVRQFVAMPLGMGYTVEAQVSGEERYGGLQLIAYAPKKERFPKKKSDILFEDLDAFDIPTRARTSFDMPTCLSKSMGIAAGGRMKQEIYTDIYGIETWDESNYGRVFIHILNSEMFKEVTGHESPPSPVSAKTYTKAGLPWFELYDEGLVDISPAESLEKVKSIKVLDKEAEMELDEDESIGIASENIVGIRSRSIRLVE